MTYYNDYSKVWVSVDVIIIGFDKGEMKILIGRRQMEPGRGDWSLYGGFVAADENIDETATRTLLNLTGLKNVFMRQVGAFGQVDRDPGDRVISVAYLALINVKDYSERLRLKHQLEWVPVDKLPKLYSDHNVMVSRAWQMMKQQMHIEPIAFHLLPELFTLTQLQRLYEAVGGEPIDKRNFRKRIKEMPFIEKTELIDKTGSKRGASLYRFNKKMYNNKFKL